MEPKQPKIIRKLLIRTALLLFTLAAAFFVIRFVMDYMGGRLDLGHADTVGTVAAVRFTPEGSQLVLIHPDGKIQEAPKYTAGKQDREAAWPPDGERIYFSSDRE